MDKEFIREYREFREWPDVPVFVYIDKELTPLYPVALYRMGDNLVIGITDMLKKSKEALMGVAGSVTVDEIINMLFDGVTFKHDRSGFYIQSPDASPKVEIPDGASTAPLTVKHKREMKRFLSACTKRDRELGQVSLTDPCATGCFVGDELVSVASFWFWGGRIADIGILTHPDYRGKGYGRTVVSALLKEGERLGKWPLYRTDDWNNGSAALCASLGFYRVFSVEGAVVTYPEK